MSVVQSIEWGWARGWRLRRAGPILSLLRTFLPLRWFAFNPRRPRVRKGGGASFPSFSVSPAVQDQSSSFSAVEELRLDDAAVRCALSAVRDRVAGFQDARELVRRTRALTLWFCVHQPPRGRLPRPRQRGYRDTRRAVVRFSSATF